MPVTVRSYPAIVEIGRPMSNLNGLQLTKTKAMLFIQY